jgi:hypothetical protein
MAMKDIAMRVWVGHIQPVTKITQIDPSTSKSCAWTSFMCNSQCVVKMNFRDFINWVDEKQLSTLQIDVTRETLNLHIINDIKPTSTLTRLPVNRKTK